MQGKSRKGGEDTHRKEAEESVADMTGDIEVDLSAVGNQTILIEMRRSIHAAAQQTELDRQRARAYVQEAARKRALGKTVSRA